MRLFISVLLVVAALPLLAEEVQVPRTISTSGESIVYVTPDEVIVGLGIETFNPNLDKAKAENDELSAKLLKAIKGLGIEDKHLQTDMLNVDLQYKDYGHATHGIEGYFARRQYSITLKDTKLFEKLIDTGLKNGANRIQGFEFKTTDLRKYRDQARKMAIKAAKEKAVDLAKELDMTVGKPRTIGEGSIGYWGGRGWGMGGNSMANASQNVAQFVPAGGGAEGEGTMPLGQIAVRASVSVTFDLQ